MAARLFILALVSSPIVVDAFSGGSVTVVPAVAVTSQAITSITVGGTTAGTALASGDTITFTFSESVFKGTYPAAPTVALTCAGGTAVTTSGVASASPGKVVVLTLSAGCANGVMAAAFSTAGDFLTFGTAGQVVTVDIATTAEASAATGVTGWTVLASGVGTDPIARFGDIEREFVLPPGVLTPLVYAPDMNIYGSTFEGGGPWEQWFDRIVLTPGSLYVQDRFLEIKMNHNMLALNATQVPRNQLLTIEVNMGYGNVSDPVSKTKMAADTHIPKSFLHYEAEVRRLKRSFTKMATIGKFPRECVDLAGRSMHIHVCSSPATEYYGTFHHLSVAYAHLDIMFPEVRDYDLLTGLLPELWGTQPMSKETEALITKKEEKSNETPKAIQEDVAKLSSKAAWAGGIGMESLETLCMEQNESGATVLAV
jgi:hypothetical protein